MMNAKRYHVIVRGVATAQLEGVFAEAWIALPSAAQRLVCADFLRANREDACSAREYARRLGAPSNLQAYADVLAAGKAQRGRRVK